MATAEGVIFEVCKLRKFVMTDLQTVQQFLGGDSVIPSVPQTELDFLPAVRTGFPYQTIQTLHERTGLPIDSILLGLGIAKRTADRRKHKSEPLKAIESESVLRLARVFVAAREVLGSDDRARKWLSRPNRSLRNLTPLSLLDTGIGFHEVMQVLGRIDHGVYS